MTVRNLFAAAAFALTLTTAAFAQSAEGNLRGTVVDPSGALIQQAQVTVIDANGLARTLTSDNSGAFELSHLAPGNYSVNVTAAGFSSILETVHIVSDKTTEDNVKLGISVEQEIDVTAL